MDEIQVVRARWWHRLALVLLLLPLLPLLVIAGILAYEASFETRYVYGWNQPLPATAVRCTVIYDPARPEWDYFSCGEFDNATEALDQMLSTGAVTIRSGVRSQRADLATMQRREVELNLAYEMRREFSASSLMRSLAVAAAALIGYCLLAWAAFSLLIWVSYGKRRIDIW